MKKCDDLENQITSVTLQKDSLQDESAHLQEQTKELQNQVQM